MLTFTIIALSLMIVWPLQPAAQSTLRTPADVLEDAEDRAAVSALEPENVSENLSDYLGIARPIVVFADGPEDPRLQV